MSLHLVRDPRDKNRDDLSREAIVNKQLCLIELSHNVQLDGVTISVPWNKITMSDGAKSHTVSDGQNKVALTSGAESQ